MFFQKRNVRSMVFLIFAHFFIFVSGGCDQDTVAVKMEKRELLPDTTLNHEQQIRIAVGSMITPKAGFAHYRRLLDYIGKKLGRPVQFVGKDKYEEVNALLKNGDLDVAFVCSGPYVAGREDFGLELLVVPQSYGKTVYYSYIIVQKESPANRLHDLRGKTFAFSDPDSNSGRLVPTYLLARMKQTPESFFSKYIYTYAHDMSIRAVAHGIVDGAAVDSLVWDYLDKTEPEYTSKTKIILKSPPYGIPPVVVRSGLDAETKKKLKKIFLDVDKDEEGRKILEGMMIDRFVSANDATYDSIREMNAWIAGSSDQKRK